LKRGAIEASFEYMRSNRVLYAGFKYIINALTGNARVTNKAQLDKNSSAF